MSRIDEYARVRDGANDIRSRAHELLSRYLSFKVIKTDVGVHIDFVFNNATYEKSKETADYIADRLLDLANRALKSNIDEHYRKVVESARELAKEEIRIIMDGVDVPYEIDNLLGRINNVSKNHGSGLYECQKKLRMLEEKVTNIEKIATPNNNIQPESDDDSVEVPF